MMSESHQTGYEFIPFWAHTPVLKQASPDISACLSLLLALHCDSDNVRAGVGALLDLDTGRGPCMDVRHSCSTWVSDDGL